MIYVQHFLGTGQDVHETFRFNFLLWPEESSMTWLENFFVSDIHILGPRCKFFFPIFFLFNFLANPQNTLQTGKVRLAGTRFDSFKHHNQTPFFYLWKIR